MSLSRREYVRHIIDEIGVDYAIVWDVATTKLENLRGKLKNLTEQNGMGMDCHKKVLDHINNSTDQSKAKTDKTENMRWKSRKILSKVITTDFLGNWHDTFSTKSMLLL